MSSGQASDSLVLSPLERHVKQALRLYDDPERLGQESPLASPYMLGRLLHERPRPVTALVRGELLRTELQHAAARLWRGPFPADRDQMLAALAEARRDPADPRYAYLVLELRCFHQFLAPQRTSDIWEQPHLLPGSKSQHYRDFDAAVKRLTGVLIDGLRPALRMERPRPPETLYGRAERLELLVASLTRKQTITLSGPGGVGKTSLAAKALEQLEAQPIFWYTIRPGFNDGPNSLLFALGAFLHQYGAANLWTYLIGASGEINDLNLAAGLLRQDLDLLAERTPILCFDDLEHLATAGFELMSPAHNQLVNLIDSLRGSAVLLLISQRPLIAGDLQLELGELNSADITRLCSAAGRTLSSAEIEQLHAYTGGNPRLLTLLLALHREDDDRSLAPAGQEAARSLLPAFQRLWRRITADERRVLQQLSVYQSYAPEDTLESSLLAELARLQLIEADGAGGVALLPALAPFVRNELSPELRAALHEQAAMVRLERGEYTAAAYHFVQSGQEGYAVQVWFPQRRQALARGEADLARPIFDAIARQRLQAAERKALDIIRAELRQFAGQYDEGLRELEQADWRDESEAGARLWMLRGELQDALGYPDQALTSYSEGLQVTARLLGRLVALHQRRGMLLHHRRDLSGSWQEIQRAEFELEVLRGLLREEEGAYDDALTAYQRAGAIAAGLADDSLLAQAERQLAAVYGRREQLAEAVAHAARSIAIYERLGDRVNLEKMRSNLSAIYVQTRQFQQALESGAPAYAFFVAVGDPYFAAVTAANLAEASYGLGRLDQAADYANQVLSLGDRFAAPYARFTLGQIALDRNQPAEAAAQFSASMAMAQENEDPYMVAYAERSLGQARLALAEHAVAEQHLRNALQAFRQLAIPSEAAAAEALLAALQQQAE